MKVHLQMERGMEVDERRDGEVWRKRIRQNTI